VSNSAPPFKRDPRPKKQKRVRRFFWKNLEAKPLDLELA
jgi:hypothetical protein